MPWLREVGDSALVLELEPTIDELVNAKAIAVAESVRQEGIRGVRDVVSTYRSVAVYFDPLLANVSAIVTALERSGSPTRINAGKTIEIPVVYGGEAGPDLDDVAALARVSREIAIGVHSSRTYRIYMLGFLPGFAYMGTLDQAIAAPRLATPRLRVPAGSVAIAGRQTGVYPRASPGGWRIIGRTALKLFDPEREPAALLAPGDQVRFVPVRSHKLQDAAAGPQPHPILPNKPTYSLTVLRAGLLTTVQDAGRWGHQGHGVSVCGPMDPVSHRLANLLVGNPEDASTLEATLIGPELRFEQSSVIAVSGADLQATLDDASIPCNTPVVCASGSVLRFGGRRAGARDYIGVAGGIAVPSVLGSRATHVLTGLGGMGGRALRAGDQVPLGEPSRADAMLRRRIDWPAPPAVGGARLRILPGPQDDLFAPQALEMLQRTRFVISPQSDRMGFRLTGGSIRPALGQEMISDVTFPGALQVPSSGEPILLMADRQTTGGYPQIATVITADLPLAGQLAPGDWVEFQACSRADAIAALIAQESRLLAVS